MGYRTFALYVQSALVSISSFANQTLLMNSLNAVALRDIHGGADGDAAYGAGFLLGVAAAVVVFPLLPAIAFYDIYQNHL